MIYEHSRYADAEIETIDRDGETVRAIRTVSYYGRDFIARKHTVVEGQRFDQLAWQYYRDPEMWWLIAAANPEWLYPDRIPGGTVVRIPDVAPLR